MTVARHPHINSHPSACLALSSPRPTDRTLSPNKSCNLLKHIIDVGLKTPLGCPGLQILRPSDSPSEQSALQHHNKKPMPKANVLLSGAWFAPMIIYFLMQWYTKDCKDTAIIYVVNTTTRKTQLEDQQCPERLLFTLNFDAQRVDFLT